MDNKKLWEILKDTGIPDHLTCLLAESIEELKSLLMRVKEESKKAGLKLRRKKKSIIMASGLINSWQIEREKVEAVTYFFLGGGTPKSL